MMASPYFFIQKVSTFFSHRHHFCSAFHVIVNSATTILLHFHQGVTPWMVSPGAPRPPPPSPSDATAQYTDLAARRVSNRTNTT